MADHLADLAADLEAGRLDSKEARKVAGRTLPNREFGDQVGSLSLEATQAYSDGRSRRAWATATIVAGVTESWGKARSRAPLLRGGMTEGVIDLQARALALLSLIEADAGHQDLANSLRRQSDQALEKIRNSSPARLAIATLDAERAIRQGRGEAAVSTMEQAVRLPGLDDGQLAAARVVLASSLRAAGRSDEAIDLLGRSAEDFVGAGLPSAALAVDLERAGRMCDSGRQSEASRLLARVAEDAARLGENDIETDARLRLGLLEAQAQHHIEAASHFRLAADAARREGRDVKVVVGLRNAADELRLASDHEGAERLLQDALTTKATPAVEVDLAKAKVILAVMRAEQGKSADAASLLDEAEATFQHRLDSLERTESPHARQHLDVQLRQVMSLRGQMGLQPGSR